MRFLLSHRSLAVPRRWVATTAHSRTGITKLLVANRGEIACRVIRTAKDMGLRTVAVFSEVDRNALHVQMADEAYCIGPAAAAQSYLSVDKIINVARLSGAQAIHPGYGFLSENAPFAAALEKAGLTFVGPPASAILAMGDKKNSKELMEAAGVPCTPGYHGDDQSTEALHKAADKIGYPVMIKPSAGGGGKGMFIVLRSEDFVQALESSRRVARASFSNDVMLIERFVQSPRHIEVQVFADKYGSTVHLFERDCSVQRRHQKVLEESPAVGLTPELRSQIGKAACDAARAVGYVGAGTVEFIMDNKTQQFFFMEMNTRLQVEHPVTEMVTKQDLVRWQLLVADGCPLPLTQVQLTQTDHVIEARVYAEDPSRNFLPCAGKIVHLRPPANVGVGHLADVRVDTGVREGDEVSPFYDPMISKLIVRGPDRAAALRKLDLALSQYEVVGVPTNIQLIRRILATAAFQRGGVTTSFIEEHTAELMPTGTEAAHKDDDLRALAAVALDLFQRHESSRRSPDIVADANSPWLITDGWRSALTHVTQVSLNSADVPDEVHNFSLTSQSVADGGGVVVRSGSISKDKTVHARVASVAPFKLHALVDGRTYEATLVVHGSKVHVLADGRALAFALPPDGIAAAVGGGGSTDAQVKAPMMGRISKLIAAVGKAVKKGEVLVVMEAMKMEHSLSAPYDGLVEAVQTAEGQQVLDGQVLVRMAKVA